MITIDYKINNKISKFALIEIVLFLQNLLEIGQKSSMIFSKSQRSRLILAP